jgi:hypothetical protein
MVLAVNVCTWGKRHARQEAACAIGQDPDGPDAAGAKIRQQAA